MCSDGRHIPKHIFVTLFAQYLSGCRPVSGLQNSRSGLSAVYFLITKPFFILHRQSILLSAPTLTIFFGKPTLPTPQFGAFFLARTFCTELEHPPDVPGFSKYVALGCDAC